ARVFRQRPTQKRHLDRPPPLHRRDLRRRARLCRRQYAGRTATTAPMTRPLPPSLAAIVSCVSGYDPTALPIPQARAVIDQLVPRLDTVEMLPLRAALGRVLARDIVSHLNVPAHDNSAMDGYAFAGHELIEDADTEL